MKSLILQYLTRLETLVLGFQVETFKFLSKIYPLNQAGYPEFVIELVMILIPVVWDFVGQTLKK